MNNCIKITVWLCNWKKRCFLKTFLLVIICTSCCCQGDESRSLNVSHEQSMSLECHVISGESSHTRVRCSCKCWIWCQSTFKCRKWNWLRYITRLSSPSSYSKQKSYESFLYKFLAGVHALCCESLAEPSLDAAAKFDFKCRRRRAPFPPLCDIDWNNDACCSAFCTDQRGQHVCPFFHLGGGERLPFVEEEEAFYGKGENNDKNETIVVYNRVRRANDFVPPFRIEVSENPKEIAVLQPFHLVARVIDKKKDIVHDIMKKVSITVVDGSPSLLQGELTKDLKNGQANFTNIAFKTTGKNFRLTVSCSSGSPEVLPWTSSPLSVGHRHLVLRPSGRTLPISPVENDTLSPAAGIIIYDVIDNVPAKKTYLANFTWKCSVSLFYQGVYPGQILGTTTQIIKDGSNEILFNDIILSSWGYSYILKITLHAMETTHWNLTCLIGPFDVDMVDQFELPLIDSADFLRVRIVFDGDFRKVLSDQRRFEIFFQNHFGRLYPKVRWRNITASEGSVVVDAVITGLTDELEKTSETLAHDIVTGKADIQYEKNKTWKANREYVPHRKLLEETGTTDGQGEDGGGLSVAWIVAIVINVILIVLFILFIIYCWFKRKKQHDPPGSKLRLYDGQPEDLMFANKADNKKSLEEKAALMERGGQTVFTVENGHHLHKHKDDRCNCYSPTCYCSVGDGRESETRFTGSSAVEENEDDPQGYPTPSPRPVFPTPEPSLEQDDFWRPDSYQGESFKEEEEEDEDLFLPGAVTEPEPVQPKEDRYYIYHVQDYDGSRELFGQLYMPVDSFLTDVRRTIDRDRDISEATRGREYRFLDENMDAVPPYQETSLDVERVFPSQEINIQYIPQRVPTAPYEEPPMVVPKRKIPAYVGPLGICNASECTRAAKIKCLDCRNTAYCSKRCMTNDAKDHRRACYKPAWRL